MADGASPGTATLRSGSTSYARALDRAHNLSRWRDEVGIASAHFRAGNDRNANAEEALDFTTRLMTSRREGCVSTMLTESGLSIALPVRHFKAPVQRKAGCEPTSAAFRVRFVLTARALQRGVTDTSRKSQRGGRPGRDPGATARTAR